MSLYDFSGWGTTPTRKPTSDLLSSILKLGNGPVNMGSGKGLSLDSAGSTPFAGMSKPQSNYSFGDGMAFSQPSVDLGSNWGAAGLSGGSLAGGDRGMFSTFFQQKYADGSTGGGYGSAGLGILQGLGGAYMGMKQYGLAKSSLEESKKQFNLNYGAQRNTTNAALDGGAKARYAQNSAVNEKPEDYMKKYGIA